jgi:hypothetical protein
LTIYAVVGGVNGLRPRRAGAAYRWAAPLLPMIGQTSTICSPLAT